MLLKVMRRTGKISHVQRKDWLAAARQNDRSCVALGADRGGIENAACSAPVGAGAFLFCVDRDDQQVRSVAHALGDIAQMADVTGRDQMTEQFASAAERFGSRFTRGVDVVGAARPVTQLEHVGNEAIEWQFDIVLRHALLIVQIAAAVLANREKGSLSFLGSLAGVAAIPGFSLYGSP